jgi:hypothetical protein
MDPKTMTLAQLKEANPEAFVEYAEELKTAESTQEVKPVEVQTPATDAPSLEAIAELIDKKLDGLEERIERKVTESLTTRDVQDNRMVLESKLKASTLPDATKKRLSRELHDVTTDGTEATEADAAKTPLEVFSALVDTKIEEAEAELKEATEGLTTVVDDGGTGELSITESGRVYSAPKGSAVNDKIAKTLGIVMASDKPVVEAAATTTDAPATA